MDYEKKYKEALEKAKQCLIYPDMPGFMRVDVIFPELKESKEERIRKMLYGWVCTKSKSFFDSGYTKEDVLTWLEKQKPVSPTYSLEQAAGIFLDALSETPYNNKPITDAQVVTKELLKFLYYPKAYNPNAVNEQKSVEQINGEDYGIDGLFHAVRILEKTLGKVEGYQSDDGILAHKAAIAAIKFLYRQTRNVI